MIRAFSVPLSIIAVWLAGSTGLKAIPSMPLTSRSSKRRVCSAAVPSAGILNSSLTLGISFTACSQPALAIVQKSDGLLVRNAKLSGLSLDSPKTVGRNDAIATIAHKKTEKDLFRFIFWGVMGTGSRHRRNRAMGTET